MATLKERLSVAERYKKTLRTSERQFTKSASGVFRAAVRGTLEKFRDLVTKEPEALAAMPVHSMVRSALSPYQEQARESVRQAFAAGRSLGLQAVVDEMSLLGVEYEYQSISADALTAALRDLDASFRKVERDLERSILRIWNDPGPVSQARRLRLISQEISTAAQAMSKRAALSAQYVTNRAYTDAQTSVRTDAPVRKMWVANFAAGPPCLTCSALHGATVALNEEFSHTQSFATNPPRVYQDLQGPPRHPNCRCRVVLVTDESEAFQDRLERFAEKSVADDILQRGFTAKEARKWSRSFSRRVSSALTRLVQRFTRAN